MSNFQVIESDADFRRERTRRALPLLNKLIEHRQNAPIGSDEWSHFHYGITVIHAILEDTPIAGQEN